MLCDEHSLPLGHSLSCSQSECIAQHRHDSVQAYLDFALCLQTLRDVGLALSREDKRGKSLLREIGREGDWDMAAKILCVPPLDGTMRFGFEVPNWRSHISPLRGVDAAFDFSLSNAPRSHEARWLLEHRNRHQPYPQSPGDRSDAVDPGNCGR